MDRTSDEESPSKNSIPHPVSNQGCSLLRGSLRGPAGAGRGKLSLVGAAQARVAEGKDSTLTHVQMVLSGVIQDLLAQPWERQAGGKEQREEERKKGMSRQEAAST